MTLKDLAVKHDYYCADSNYYSTDASVSYEGWDDFLYDYADADIDMNLVFRWDIKKKEESDDYEVEIFIIHQRKGLFTPITISYIGESDTETFVAFMDKHWKKLQQIWTPLSSGPTVSSS